MHGRATRRLVLMSALLTAPLASFAADAAPSAGAGASGAGSAVSVTPAVAPLVLLDPTELRSRPTLARGCWVWMFPETNYQGKDSIAVAGPAEVKSCIRRSAWTGTAMLRA